MKKTIRIVSLLTVLAICFSLCGCNLLDELRESRATVLADGTVRLYDGTEYKPLPECEELTPEFNEYEMVYVAAEDVPLLLTDFFYENCFDKSDDGLFLQAYTEESVVYYCRTDAYDSVLERINNGFTAEKYCYPYVDYEEAEYIYCTLTPAQAEAVAQVCQTQTPEELPKAAIVDFEYMADLYLCSGDMLFKRDTVDVCVLEGEYYVVEYGFDATTLYTVPEELSDVFAGILEKQIESDSYWEEYWEEDW